MPGHRTSFGFLGPLPRLLFFLARMANRVAFLLYRGTLISDVSRGRRYIGTEAPRRFDVRVRLFLCVCTAPMRGSGCTRIFCAGLREERAVCTPRRMGMELQCGRRLQRSTNAVHACVYCLHAWHVQSRCALYTPAPACSAIGAGKAARRLQAHSYMAGAAHSAGSSCSSATKLNPLGLHARCRVFFQVKPGSYPNPKERFRFLIL